MGTNAPSVDYSRPWYAIADILSRRVTKTTQSELEAATRLVTGACYGQGETPQAARAAAVEDAIRFQRGVWPC